ncbi:MAG: peptidoglycan-binding protein LysM, partial [Polaromonas sp.]|nr:peptidoglycan-binding protein LysM [Polaromonas sp.]MBP6142421.1 peptidoglycan-binding protein LysM [Polaromonas sp.]MBP8873855.1 peptidoglycan-binding protein LysM [Polaromonas sp.]MBP9057754.1 peptidoglycan-binding protein LysM [Polaromonas sp.]MBP9831452.1 peptidoglycan-binding protein LysM [Polaromonas sp.]
MGMFSFIKEAGEKLFGSKEVEDAAAKAATDEAARARSEELNKAAGDGIAKYIEAQNLGIEGLYVTFDGATSTVELQGT